jgi:hypothetical protein
LPFTDSIRNAAALFELRTAAVTLSKQNRKRISVSNVETNVYVRVLKIVLFRKTGTILALPYYYEVCFNQEDRF